MDTYDLASDARDREISHILTDRDRGKLEAIDEAISRVEDGSYGLCEDCGAEIAEGRLQALPFTRLCVTCQSDRERESRMNKRYEQDPTVRRLGVGDDGDSES
jgi:DnaK suppressor protein